MQYIILEHELNLSEEHGKITFLECLKSTTISSSQVFPSIIFVFFMEFLRLKASESEEKNKVKELEDTQVRKQYYIYVHLKSSVSGAPYSWKIHRGCTTCFLKFYPISDKKLTCNFSTLIICSNCVDSVKHTQYLISVTALYFETKTAFQTQTVNMTKRSKNPSPFELQCSI